MLSLLFAASAVLFQVVNAQNFTSLSCITESKGVHVPGTIPCNPYEPLQQRVAYAGSNGMTVSWSTYSQLDTPQVWYGESPLCVSTVVNGTSVTFPTSRVYENHVKITGLKPNTKYWYRTSYQLSFAFYFEDLSFLILVRCTEIARDALTGLQTHLRLRVQLAMRLRSPLLSWWISA
jgi:hypothetical protein